MNSQVIIEVQSLNFDARGRYAQVQGLEWKRGGKKEAGVQTKTLKDLKKAWRTIVQGQFKNLQEHLKQNVKKESWIQDFWTVSIYSNKLVLLMYF